MGATGDIVNNFESLRRWLIKIKYDREIDHERICRGSSPDLLPIIHFALLEYSGSVAEFLTDRGYDIYGRNDQRFMDNVFRLLRSEFAYFPALSVSHFLSSSGFAERKMMLVCDLVAKTVDLAAKLEKEKRQRAKRSRSLSVATRRTISSSNKTVSKSHHVGKSLEALKSGMKRTRKTKRRASVDINAGEDKENVCGNVQKPNTMVSGFGKPFRKRDEESNESPLIPPIPTVGCSWPSLIESYRLARPEITQRSVTTLQPATGKSENSRAPLSRSVTFGGGISAYSPQPKVFVERFGAISHATPNDFGRQLQRVQSSPDRLEQLPMTGDYYARGDYSARGDQFARGDQSARDDQFASDMDDIADGQVKRNLTEDLCADGGDSVNESLSSCSA
eukprot:911233_1